MWSTSQEFLMTYSSIFSGAEWWRWVQFAFGWSENVEENQVWDPRRSSIVRRDFSNCSFSVWMLRKCSITDFVFSSRFKFLVSFPQCLCVIAGIALQYSFTGKARKSCDFKLVRIFLKWFSFYKIEKKQ